MPTGYTVCVGCNSPFIFADMNVKANMPMRCAGPSRFAAPAIAGKNVSEMNEAPTLMGQGAASSSYDDPATVKNYTPEQ
eukprot:16108630-Heterocapsa_arctica.AAC.1